MMEISPRLISAWERGTGDRKADVGVALLDLVGNVDPDLYEEAKADVQRVLDVTRGGTLFPPQPPRRTRSIKKAARKRRETEETAAEADADADVDAEPEPEPEVVVPPAPALRLKRTALASDAELFAVEDSRGGLDHVALALQGWQIQIRDQFDELLCLQHLQDLSPLEHQVDAATKVLRHFGGRALLADEAGLGRTAEAGMVMLELVLRSLAPRSLVLTPEERVGSWCQALQRKFDLSVTRLELSEDRDLAAREVEGEELVAVCGYGGALTESGSARLLAGSWDLVVADEAHLIGPRGSAGHELVRRLESPYLLLLTATPAQEGTQTLAGLASLLKPALGSSPEALEKLEVAQPELGTPRLRQQLRELLGDVMIRNTRAIAGTAAELPPVRYRTEVVESEPEKTSRLGDLLEALDDFAQDSKAVVFVQDEVTRQEVNAALEGRSIPSASLGGGMGAADKATVARLLQGEVDVAVATDAGGAGCDLQHANVLIHYDVLDRPLAMEQRLGRLHRFGQTREVQVLYLCVGGSAEEERVETLTRARQKRVADDAYNRALFDRDFEP